MPNVITFYSSRFAELAESVTGGVSVQTGNPDSTTKKVLGDDASPKGKAPMSLVSIAKPPKGKPGTNFKRIGFAFRFQDLLWLKKVWSEPSR